MQLFFHHNDFGLHNDDLSLSGLGRHGLCITPHKTPLSGSFSSLDFPSAGGKGEISTVGGIFY